MVEKSPEAFRNISEVATLLDVPAHVLRFWETRFSQVKPVKRSGGRRYYRPDDITLLKRIRALLYEEGYTIKGAQQVLKEKSPAKASGTGAEAAAAAPVTPAGIPPASAARALELLREASDRLARL